MNLNIGKSLTQDPWFVPYMDTKTIDVTKNYQTVTHTFTVEEETNKYLKMVFELGTINDQSIPTKLYFDNIELSEEIEDTDPPVVDTEKPVIELNDLKQDSTFNSKEIAVKGHVTENTALE
ncbi:hypothetical protein LC087_13045 [Bacillus carboniphilus]|uniref:NEAT domain-containing protein n=1 Tax=Bacillus carboniphilus TaxID=86663 RepID=A0ABY9K0W4_9BACI|nr:hypothetical protein [Bacillus carboniphilus]WLR44340.1 hypothetical protein LC087_13045 [Bacillus carboniphilus]